MDKCQIYDLIAGAAVTVSCNLSLNPVACITVEIRKETFAKLKTFYSNVKSVAWSDFTLNWGCLQIEFGASLNRGWVKIEILLTGVGGVIVVHPN
jgi:hypothetical protein